MSSIVSTTFNNLEELRANVEHMILVARDLGHHPSTVYFRPMHLNLVDDELTDRSVVLNAVIYEVTP